MFYSFRRAIERTFDERMFDGLDWNKSLDFNSIEQVFDGLRPRGAGGGRGGRELFGPMGRKSFGPWRLSRARARVRARARGTVVVARV